MNKTKKTNRTLLSIMTVIALVMSLLLPAVMSNRSDAGKNIKVGDAYYTILPAGNGTVEYAGAVKKTCTSVHIPATIKINGQEYKVVGIKAGALKGNKDLIKVTIGANVKTIGKKAFYGCKNLNKLSVFSKNLTSKTVAKDAFKGTAKKGWAVVPENRVDKYGKLFKACGMAVKKWDFRYVCKEMQDKTTWDNYEQGQPLPDPQITMCGFYYKPENKEVSASTKAIGIPVFAKSMPDARLFGDWKKEGTYALLYHCNICGRNCEPDMNAEHIPLMDCDYWYTAASAMSFNGWFFYPDNDPLKVVYEFTLPDGLVCVPGSVEVWKGITSRPRTEYSDIHVSGNKVTVTINDLKQEPFYYRFDKEAYDKDPFGYLEEADKKLPEGQSIGMPPAPGVSFKVKFGENPQTDNVIKATVTYEYKGVATTTDLGDLMVHCKTYKY